MASKGSSKKPPRRPPPTIDLSATEVRVEPPRDAASAPSNEPDTMQAEPVPPTEHSPSPAFPDIAPEPEPADTQAAEPAASQPAETAPDETVAAAEAAPSAAQASPDSEHLHWQRPPEDSAESPSAPASPPPPARSPWPIIGAALGGAAALLLALFALGLIDMRDNGSAQIASRLAALEAQSARQPAQPAIDPKALEDLASRVARTEAAANAPRASGADPALASRLSSIEVAVKSLGDAVATLNTRGDEVTAALRAARERAEATAKTLAELQAQIERAGTADKGETDQLAARIAALESSTRTVEQKIETPGSTAADRDVRLAVLATALKDAVERGAPYLNELNALKPLIDDQPSVGALERFSTTGLPTAAALASELAALVPSLSQAAAPQASDGGLLGRLQSHANRLVRVRPADDPVGDDPATIVERVDARAQRADIAGALTELARLPANVRGPADSWIAKAQARAAALRAADKVAGASYGALARPQH